MDVNKCPLCENNGGVTSTEVPEKELFLIECARCGRYLISDDALEDLIDSNLPNKYLASGRTRSASDEGSPLVLVNYADIENLVKSTRKPNPLEALDLILLYMGKRIEAANRPVFLRPFDYPIIYGCDSNEFHFLLIKLAELNLITSIAGDSYQLTIGGWKRLMDIKSKAFPSNLAFVAMWFGTPMKGIFEDGFAPALKECGYNPERIDILEHNEKICDRIIADIRRSSLMVADFTGHRGGVYFEAGFAMGLGIPVIWTCHEGDFDQLHFDTRQYNHIKWNDVQDLKDKLINRIKATIPMPEKAIPWSL